MNLREKYTNETGNSSITIEADNGIITISEDYVNWLENEIKTLKQGQTLPIDSVSD